ncbi:Exocyst complex component 4 [Cryptotermes secundus]|uniref:Exocyst complex component Sec8 n=1 Tax=Cryptotermes secundus TaxID=105785 RepID=A0A2J7RD24_9NEOP|nr:Exocyst complex component 4 [Cryptotermes secundus]
MSAVAPPTKPPRGVKHQKETSGLLMSVIRTLSASESNEQRDREKAKLEKEYKRSDQKLDELVSLHDQDLTQVMQLFGKLSARVTTSREKIHAVKENLQACKLLLHCRRDELKKLWLEGIEHKHVLQLLEEIDQLREVPSQLTAFLDKKHYLHATQLLVSALCLGEGSLEGVEALREVRTDLQTKKQKLHSRLLTELTSHLYIVSTHDVVALRRQGSGRDGNPLNSPFQHAGELRGFARLPKTRLALLDMNVTSPNTPSLSSGMNQTGTEEELKGVEEDVDAADPEANSEHFMAILVECLALLNKVPDIVETIKVQMQTELLAIIGRTTQQLLDLSQQPPHSLGARSTPLLLELLQTVFDQFRCVAAAHASVLHSFAQAADRHRIDVRLYEMPDVWSKVQAVLQLLLTDYLDIQNIAGDPQQAPASFSEPTSDISVYFARRRPPRQKRTPLFKFDYSSHALSINSYLKEQRGPSAKEYNETGQPQQREKLLVCSPDPRNITQIFIPLMKFIEEIEHAIGCTPGSPCTLNAFLADYIKEVFLGRHHMMVAASIESATKSVDAWRAITNPELMRGLGLSRPLLQSTVTVERCIQDLRELMQALPAYAEHFLSIICNILHNYRETCQAAYRGIVQPESEDKRICSAAWLKDEDISRFIKSLPNWTDLQAQKMTHHRRRPLRREETTEEESPEDIRQRNMREAEILATNLGEGGISAHEILSDVGQLKGLAQLQESMEWFSTSILLFASELPRASATSPGIQVSSEGIPAMPESSVKALMQLAQEFEELANTCLLVLHLEVRVQCFHYLLPQANNYNRLVGGVDSQEPDPKVLELSRVLVSIDEAMNSSLQPRKLKYIVEGLGHLIAKILISSAQYIDRIDERGIQKMCRNIFALQQTLTNITMAREIALDHARHYFELFYLAPEEILSGVMENGPQFSELEYMNAFQLVNRSQAEPNYGAINTHLSRLSDILGEVGITV